MRSHFPPGSIICCMLRHDIVSLLNTSRLVFSRISLTKYKSYHLHRCTVPHSQPTITLLFIVFSNEILAAVLYMQIFMHEQWRSRLTDFKRQDTYFKFHLLHSQCISILQMQPVSVLLSFSTRSLLSAANLKLLEPTCNTEKKKKTKMSGVFFALRT